MTSHLEGPSKDTAPAVVVSKAAEPKWSCFTTPQTLEQLGCLGHDSAVTQLHQAVCKQKRKTTQMKTISSSFLPKLCIWAEGKNWKVEIDVQCKV